MYEMSVVIRTAKGSRTLPSVSTRAARAVQSYLEGKRYDIPSAELGALESLVTLAEKLANVEGGIEFSVPDNGFACYTPFGEFVTLKERHNQIAKERDTLKARIQELSSALESARVALDGLERGFPGYREKAAKQVTEKSAGKSAGKSDPFAEILADLL